MLLPIPVERHVKLLGPDHYVARLEETSFPEDKNASDAGQLSTFNAFSADGDTTGELVFVNYGQPQDYETVESMGVDVTGKIVIAKYGPSWRGIKLKVAAEDGAIACLIYSDPEEDGCNVDDPYPLGPMRPEHGVQRGSVMDMPLHPGDPLSPGWGSSEGARRLERTEATTIMSIPVLPISYGDALPMLRTLGGAVAPDDDWKGALPITYHLGPGPAVVRVALRFDWQDRSIYDSHDFFMRYHDPTFAYGKTVAGFTAMAMLRMAYASILPFSFSDAALTYADYVNQVADLADRKLGKDVLDVADLRVAVGDLAEAGMGFDAALEAATGLGSAVLESGVDALDEINTLVYKSERTLGIQDGLPRRPWFRHMMHAPGFYTGYGVKTIAAVREAVERDNIDEARRYTAVLAGVTTRMAERVRKVTARMQDLL